MWNKFVIIYNRIKEYFMGRPRVLKFGEGEILLKNLTTEQSDFVQKVIENASGIQSVVSGPVAGDIVEIKADEPIKIVDVSELKETALGLIHNREKLEYQIVTVKYNPISGAAKVTEVRNAGSFRLAGVNNFKMELVKLEMI